MSFLAPGSLRSCARRVTAALMLGVQVVVLLASLTELQYQPVGPRGPAIAQPFSTAAQAPADLGAQGSRHDEATCPACIVRSLHARIEVLAPLSAALLDHSDTLLPSLTSKPAATPLLSNLSRAPPLAG